MNAVLGARLGVTARVLAAVFGSALATAAGSVGLALAVSDRKLGIALAVSLALPLWVVAMIPGFLARRAWVAWAGYVGSGLLFAAIAWWLRRGG